MMTNTKKVRLKDLDFKHVEKRTGKVRTIKWNENWDERYPTTDQLVYVQALASAQNEALEIMQNEKLELIALNKQLVELNTNAQKAFDIQKMINVKAITDFNARIHTLVEENTKLLKEKETVTEL